MGKLKDFLQMLAHVSIIFGIIFALIRVQNQKEAMEQQANIAREKTKLSVWLDLFDTFNRINEFEGASEMEIPIYQEMKSTDNEQILIFHHTNLIFKMWFYNKQNVFSKEEMKGFENWMHTVVFPWLSKSHNLSYDWMIIVNTGDLYPQPYLDWLKNLPGHGQIERKANSER